MITQKSFLQTSRCRGWCFTNCGVNGRHSTKKQGGPIVSHVLSIVQAKSDQRWSNTPEDWPAADTSPSQSSSPPSWAAHGTRGTPSAPPLCTALRGSITKAALLLNNFRKPAKQLPSIAPTAAHALGLGRSPILPCAHACCLDAAPQQGGCGQQAPRHKLYSWSLKPSRVPAWALGA